MNVISWRTNETQFYVTLERCHQLLSYMILRNVISSKKQKANVDFVEC